MEALLAVALGLTVVVLLAAGVGLVLLALALRSARGSLRHVQAQSADAAQHAAAVQSAMQSRLATLQAEVHALGKYRTIVDAEAYANKLRLQAQHTLNGASQEASRMVQAAQQQAAQIAAQARAQAQHTRQLEQTAAAMRNVIDGYGDRYVMPAASLLDDLAEEYGFAQAGQQLKAWRERVRSMIKQRQAAVCDHMDNNVRTAAVTFVLDAFNGKVDSILAEVRHDNYGTLRQQILDAYELINHHASAFYNARITAEYRDARLEELRWATIAHELKQREREQQRLIKERIREEERAQREYDRAAKEAQKEESALRQAMEKARRELEQAGAQQRAEYEARLQELTQRLQQAEEKNQRAVSMAQQTKAGHVYVISNVGSFGENVYKIGMTRRLEPLDRIRELGDASVPFSFDVHALISSDDAPALEAALHKQLMHRQINKVNARKEFFRATLQEVRQVVEQQGVQASWTIAAEAKEYRETQAIESAMAKEGFDEKSWREQQLRQHGAREWDHEEAVVN